MAAAKKNNNRISVNALERVAKEQFSSVVTKRWFDIELTVKRVLSLAEMLSFVRDAADACFSDEHGFMPELLDFAIKRSVVRYYSNLTLPENIEKCYELLCLTGISAVIEEEVDAAQYRAMLDAIYRKARHMCDTEISTVQRELTRLVESFEETQRSMEEMLSDVDAGDLARMAHAVAEHGLPDGGKIVRALAELREEDAAASSDEDGRQA